jgi:hypothetical protein
VVDRLGGVLVVVSAYVAEWHLMYCYDRSALMYYIVVHGALLGVVTAVVALGFWWLGKKVLS